MAHLLVKYELAAFDTWYEIYEDRSSVRSEYGWQASTIYSRQDSETKVVVLSEWDNATTAREYFDSTEFRRAMQDAGVVRKPDVTVLERRGTVSISPEADGEDDAAEPHS